MKRIVILITSFLIFFNSASAYCGTNVLFLGDSLSADQNAGLGRNLQLPPGKYSMKTAAFCGYSPDNYTNATAEGKMSSPCGAYLQEENGSAVANEEGAPEPKIIVPPLESLMNFKHSSKKADVVVVQLGTNLYGDLSEKNGEIKISQECSALLAAIRKQNPKAKILWMAPPKIWSYGDPPNSIRVSQAVSDKMFQLIVSSAHQFKSVTIVDSREYTDFPPHTGDGDGTHFDDLQTRWLSKTKAIIETLSSEVGNSEIVTSNESARLNVNTSKTSKHVSADHTSNLNQSEIVAPAK